MHPALHAAVETLLERYDQIDLAIDPESVEYEPSYLVHGIRSLPLLLGRSG